MGIIPVHRLFLRYEWDDSQPEQLHELQERIVNLIKDLGLEEELDNLQTQQLQELQNRIDNMLENLAPDVQLNLMAWFEENLGILDGIQ